MHDNLKWQPLQSKMEDHKLWLTGASSQLSDALFRYIFCYRYHVVVWVVLGKYVPLMLPDVTKPARKEYFIGHLLTSNITPCLPIPP